MSHHDIMFRTIGEVDRIGVCSNQTNVRKPG